MTSHARDVEELFCALAAIARLRPGQPTDESRARAIAFVRAAPNQSLSHALGAAYEASLDNRTRRAGGIHYTPTTIVSRVVRVALDAVALGRVPTDLRVLDPAMGAGAFVCEALRALVLRSGEDDNPTVRGAIARRCLFGIDLDPSAVIAARRAVWLEVGDPSLPLDAFDANFVHADALLDAPLGGSPGVPWREAFRAARTEDRGGFDVIVGNPPYLGGKRIRTIHGDAYADHLVAMHPGANKNVDLAGHFVRRSFDGLSEDGVLGLVTTNTIAQGDTREGGLAHVVRRGGTIFAAERKVAWPGTAGVVTSLVWIKRGAAPASCSLDGRSVARIDPFLSSIGRDRDPARLPTMRRRAFIGCFLRGSGFVFDDVAPGATSLAEMQRILAASPSSREVVKPFMGGEELLNEPRQRPHRFVVHFGDRSLAEAGAHPELLELVEQKVRPFRASLRSTKIDDVHRAAWWKFANTRPELEASIAPLDRVIAIPRMSSRPVAALLPKGIVYSDQLVVIASDSFAVFALLSSRVHGAWARFTCSTLGAGLRYTPTDAFETFAPPFDTFAELERDPDLDRVGRAFHHARAELLETRGVGLSKLGRMLEDRAIDDEDIAALRCAREELDRAVLSAYGWHDLNLRDWNAEVVVERLFTRNESLAGGHGVASSPTGSVSGSAQQRVPVE